MKSLNTLSICILSLFFLLSTSTALDTLAANESLKDEATLVSADETYALGFFSLGTSKNRYLGIWYNKISPLTVVWVANRETPISNTSGMLRASSEGSLLVLHGGDNTVIWSSNTSVPPTPFVPVVQLLSTGNLVVRNARGGEDFVWESFDHPTDTFLPGMKFGKDLVTGRDRRWTSWKSVDDPSPGVYVSFMDTNGFPQLFETQANSAPHSRFGPWNGITFNGMPSLGANSIFTHEFVFNDKEVYYGYKLVNSSVLSRVYLGPDGNTVRRNWIDRTQSWFLYWNANIDRCSQFGLCGPYGSCNPDNSPACSCMEGFEPRSPDEWNAADWSSGCRPKTSYECGKDDGFRIFKNVKLPDTRRSWYNLSMTLGECEMACKGNCSCTAYANIDITRGGSGCLLWFDDLMDVRAIDESQDLHVRMAASDLTIVTVPGTRSKSDSNKKKRIVIAVVSSISGLVLIGLIVVMYVWSKKKRSPDLKTQGKVAKDNQAIDEEYSIESQQDDTELSSFSLSQIAKATNDFSISNLLGEGGFGPVYKGVLEDGREIAVKRLSETSRQGINEFKNEVRWIAKLQHRNLVKLLGYCIQGDESMLIYEYMPNKSLDTFLFDNTKRSILDWPQRFLIIHGIARGLLYLHQDSRLKIVHRDLKASNILLDLDMNPKISDFGLARMFKENENEANTNKVVGTLGYISPEYAVNGIFSEKSDVFSYGVLVLEIVSGKKNRGFSREKDSDNLLGHAWRLYEEGKALELVSETLRDSCVDSEALRSIHIGLLCVQHHAKDRPTMSSVVLMFGKEGALPPPNQPAFFTEGSFPEFDAISINGLTMTALEAR